MNVPIALKNNKIINKLLNLTINWPSLKGGMRKFYFSKFATKERNFLAQVAEMRKNINFNKMNALFSENLSLTVKSFCLNFNLILDVWMTIVSTTPCFAFSDVRWSDGDVFLANINFNLYVWSWFL